VGFVLFVRKQIYIFLEDIDCVENEKPRIQD